MSLDPPHAARRNASTMLPLHLPLERYLAREPRQRDVRLGPPQLHQRHQRHLRHLGMPGHGGGGEHAVGADEIGALAQRLAGEADRFLAIAADELAIGNDDAIDRGERIARGEPQRIQRRGEIGNRRGYFPASISSMSFLSSVFTNELSETPRAEARSER